jgi:hypothetical protein
VNQDVKQLPVSLVALRAERYSTDGDNIIVSLRAKYSTAERKYSIPVECFHDLIVDLRRLNASAFGDGSNLSDPAEPLLPLEFPLAPE